ncbi:AsmA family protein [Ramlibacter sp.]|uniref:AsmA family protein n=1 Tax=Ramlibacter sp. TaxID=1917967 RepID=UPI002D277094|nr:AsmA family protein [Ramlibacter sp.]HYD75989.1 AsmA family protein [Ramlibacter sp.]
MKALKILATVLLGLLLLVVAAAAVLAWRFDADWTRRRIEQAVLDRTQRTLRIEGDFSLAFYPSIGLKLGKARLSEPASPQQAFASVEGAHVSVQLIPLLSRRVVVDRVELDGVRARIVRRKDGSFNFDDLAGRGGGQPGATSAPAPAAQDEPIALDIAGVRIARSAAVLVDEKAGRNIELADVNLRTGRLSQAAASGPLEVAFRATAGQPRLAAAIQLAGNYRYDTAQARYALSSLDLDVQGDVLGWQQVRAAVDAGEASFDGAQGIAVKSLVATLAGRLGQDALQAKFEVPQLAAANGGSSAANATGSIKLAGPQRQLDASANLSGVQGSAMQWDVGNLGVQWKLQQGPLASSGQLAGSVQAQLEPQRLVLSKVTGDLQLAHPQLPMKQVQLPLQASARLDWGRSQASGEWSTRLDDSHIQGRFELARFSPLAAVVDLKADRLDVDRYFPPSSGAAAKAGATSAPASAPAAAKAPGGASGEGDRIDLSFLRGLDLRGTAQVGDLKARNLKLNAVAAKFQVDQGRMEVNPLSARLYGGSLAGSLAAQADGNRVAVRQTLDNVAIGPLIRDFAQSDVLEGRGRLVLDVGTAGPTAQAMRQALNGTARVSLRDGAVKGINLAKSLRQAKAMLKAGGQETTGDRTEKTDFSELTASFRITNGVARSDDLDAKSPFLRAGGSGTIDLVHERLDYLAKVTVVGTSKGQDGREFEDLRGLTIPLRVAGSFEDPSFQLDWGGLAAGLAKQQVQERVEEKVKERLGERLGKPLGGKSLGDALRGLRR